MENLAPPVELLHYYREAEVCGADLLQRLLRQADDPELQMYLTRQLADEARHIQVWTELMGAIGVTPRAARRGYRQALHKWSGTPSSVLDLLALTHVIEERVRRRYHEHAARAGEDARIVEVLQLLAADKEWHLRGIHDWLAKFEKKEGRTRVTAALDYYRTLEAGAYAALLSDEERRRTADLQAAIIPW